MPKGLVPKSSSTPASRSISASEIARNVKTFETWSSYNGCEQVAFSDLPDSIKPDVISVFDVKGKLPQSLVTKTSSTYKRVEKLSPGLHKFLLRAYDKMPSLFCQKSKKVDDCLLELGTVFLAWSQLNRMKETKERWSEADFAANVYNLLRSPAMRECSYRNQCSIQLPQPLPTKLPVPPTSRRIISTKIIVPDGSMFIRAASLQKLSQARSSAYKRINEHPSTKRTCGHDGESTFRYQATPALRPQPTPMFEFAGAFLEDKKPSCDSLEHAFRQNRMACAAAQRQLNSFCIESPVFGLIWADEKVKAHVDWCLKEGKHPKIFSAAYPGSIAIEEADQEENGTSPSAASRSTAYSQPVLEASEFFEWDLFEPADILCVFIVLRNLDRWIAHGFRDRVLRGINARVKAVVEEDKPYMPWRIEESALKAKVLRSSSLSNTENTVSPRSSNASSIPGLPLSSKHAQPPLVPVRKSTRSKTRSQNR
ncbi:hypothetical protein ACEPAI_553 [Sanghuangporus weigelae]